MMLRRVNALKQHARGLNGSTGTRQHGLWRLVANATSDVQNHWQDQHILLLPWFGARKKDVVKYRSMWEQQGVPPKNVVILQPAIVDILVPSRLETFVEQENLRLRCDLTHPVTVHSFSNGGFILLSMLLACGSNGGLGSDLAPKVQKFVLDSAPAPINPDMTARALISVVLGHGNPEASLLFLPLRFLCEMYLHLPSIERKQMAIWSFWQHDAPVRPILSLLSGTDPMIDVEQANKYLDQQEARGCLVHRKTWESTAHVSHYRSDPDGYLQALDDFHKAI